MVPKIPTLSHPHIPDSVSQSTVNSTTNHPNIESHELSINKIDMKETGGSDDLTTASSSPHVLSSSSSPIKNSKIRKSADILNRDTFSKNLSNLSMKSNFFDENTDIRISKMRKNLKKENKSGHRTPFFTSQKDKAMEAAL
jgi:hypothetical protein